MLNKQDIKNILKIVFGCLSLPVVLALIWVIVGVIGGILGLKTNETDYPPIATATTITVATKA
jgi:TM2 domain-containing membrane protein YozV